jgi:predicted dienelactone hydrolase
LRAALALTATVVITLPAQGKLYFIYGPIKESISIQSLSNFAKTGEVNKELQYYFNLAGFAGLNSEQIAAFREALRYRTQVDPIQLSRFFNSPTGEAILEQAGALIAIQGGRNGKYALRGALIQAALDSRNGLTLLNFLEHLPTNMQFNLEQIIEAGKLIDLLAKGTQLIVQDIKTLAEQRAAQETSLDFAKLVDPRQPGIYGVASPQTWTLTDPKRDRTLEVIVYQPQRWRSGKTPIVIISHGLASRPEDFDREATHLASHGYWVLMPRHPGSDTGQLQDLLDGYSKELFKVQEFIDRPRDISFLIDELERRNAREFEGKLDLNHVIAMGHSFGGYTVLALAGATIDFDNLDKICDRRAWGPNLSLLLQCRALDLPRQAYSLRDDRIAGVIAMNPVNSVIFGEKGLKKIKIPVVLGAGSNDPATPAAIEQVQTFIWLDPAEKYLFLVEGQAHVNFSKLDASAQALINSFPQLTLPQQRLLDQYANAINLAFAEVYGARNLAYLPFLTSAYGKYISRQPNPLYVLESDSDLPLSRLFNQFKPGDQQEVVPPSRAIQTP